MLQPIETTDDAEARAALWSIQGDFIYRHHNEPRVQLYVPKEETFSIPLKYIDVTRSTHTDLHMERLLKVHFVERETNLHRDKCGPG